jgi:putative aminopeptidase FrvX
MGPAGEPSLERLRALVMELMLIPGLSGYEGRVRRRLSAEMRGLGLATTTDRPGNLIATAEGDPGRPSVMLFAHMDQLGFVVRRIEPGGLIRLERLGGVPERALAAQQLLICVGEGRDVPAVIANKSHHATTPEEKYRVVPYQEIVVDAGFSSAGEARAAGIDIGSPVVYAPEAIRLAGERLAGTSIDDRAGCAVVVEAARLIAPQARRPTVHFVFSSQEEFNLRGALVAAQRLKPEIAIQLDLMLAADTPDMQARGDLALGAGPGMSLYNFHGRGTLNGTLPHPALVSLFERAAREERIQLQRSAQVGVLTDSSYVQLVHDGVAAIDLGFPCRYTHSAREVCDLADLEGLCALVVGGILRIEAGFSLDRDDYPS